MIKRLNFIVFVFLWALVLSGCSQKAKVSGTVKFPDGSTLNKGTVVFESSSLRVSGAIKNGKFSLGEKKEGDGVPFGTYKGWITGAVEAERPPGSGTAAPAAEPRPPRKPGDPPPMPRPAGGRGAFQPPKYLIDQKFESAETSGMTIEVKSRGSMVYNIDVTAPSERK